MNYDGIHEDFIALEKREEGDVAFTVLGSVSISEGRQKMYGGFIFGGATVLGLLISFPIFQGGWAVVTGIVAGVLALFIFTKHASKPLVVTATPEKISLGEISISPETWQGFILKNAEYVVDPKGNRTEDHRIFIRVSSVDRATKYTISKNERSADIINQMNMLVTEGVTGSVPNHTSRAAASSDDWV